MRRPLAQGTSRVAHASAITDGNGDALTVDGWSVLAYAAAETVGGALLGIWSSADDRPAGVGEASAAGRDVKVFITPEQTNAWSCDRVVLQAFITSPSGDQTERIINATYDFERRIVAA